MPEPTKAKVGDQFTSDGTKYTVAEACATNNGRWFCTTHDEGFRNQLQKDFHLSTRGPHVLAWICFEHGPEVP